MTDELRNIVEKLKKDFRQYESECKGILLFGSYAKKNATERSDIDICLILPSRDTLHKLYEKFGGKYDFKVFENLPLFIKIDVIKNHIVVFGDKLEISEYFYHFRKLWIDMEPRIKENRFESFEERMQNRRRWLNEKEKILGKIRNV